jgi:hypothetical protein
MKYLGDRAHACAHGGVLITSLVVSALAIASWPVHRVSANPPGSTPATAQITAFWFFAHPDDEFLAAAGDIHHHQDSGVENVILLLSKGPHSAACNLATTFAADAPDMRAKHCEEARVLESRVAASAQGVGTLIHLPDYVSTQCTTGKWSAQTCAQYDEFCGDGSSLASHEFSQCSFPEHAFQASNAAHRRIIRFIVEDIIKSVLAGAGAAGKPGKTAALKGHSPNDYYAPDALAPPVRGGHADHAFVASVIMDMYRDGLTNVRFYRIGHLAPDASGNFFFQCGEHGEGHVYRLSEHQSAVKQMARHEYTYVGPKDSGRHGIAGRSVPKLMANTVHGIECIDFPWEI